MIHIRTNNVLELDHKTPVSIRDSADIYRKTNHPAPYLDKY